MTSATQNSYTRLQEHLATWKDRQGIYRPDTSLRQQFQLVAQETLLPELRKLAHILEEGGVKCEVFTSDMEDMDIGIRVDTLSAVLRLSPADRPTCIRAVIAGGRRPNDDLEWLIPYHQVANGGLERELQAVMLRLLTHYQTAA
jgi:hypothetical protein